MLELAEKIVSLTGSKSELVFKELPKDDPLQRRPDIALAQKTLDNWRPKINIDKGLEKTIKYFEDTLNQDIQKMARSTIN